MAHKVLLTFFISMLPVVELRGGLPYGIALGLDYPLALIAAVLGNMVPVRSSSCTYVTCFSGFESAAHGGTQKLKP